jgi:chemotaxis methyl-accepting protein methylase
MPGAMNQYLDLQQFSLTPDLSPAALKTTLASLLVPGIIADRQFERLCQQLDERFRIFVATCPVPEWSPGLQIDAEIRRQYEVYLPLTECRAALAAFCKLACRYEPNSATTSIAAVLSWPDALARLLPLAVNVNPARLLRRLAAAEQFRFAFLAALFIPKSFGGSFHRYPLQAAFLHRWLSGQKKRLLGRVAILDAACGSGEGTYAAAAAVVQLGFSVVSSLVEGSTLEPLELAAAAHGWFPHDQARSLAFREQLRTLLASGAGRMIRFSREDLCSPRLNQNRYDMIICNGLLGGPLLHRQETLTRVISLLAARLNRGGILLAADHFHGGWKQSTPSATIKELLTASGLQAVEPGEGIGAVRTG